MSLLEDKLAVFQNLIGGIDFFLPVDQAFFAVYMFPCLYGIDGHLCMVVVRRGDNDRINVGIGEHVMVMTESFYGMSGGKSTPGMNVIGRCGQPKFGMEVIYIADPGDGHVEVPVPDLCIQRSVSHGLVKFGFLQESQGTGELGTPYSETNNPQPDQFTLLVSYWLYSIHQILEAQFPDDLLLDIVAVIVRCFSENLNSKGTKYGNPCQCF